VDAVEALRAAVHLHETERGPLVESLFPEWRGASLRRHGDQALAAESELRRRLASSYVARRLGEQATEAALRPALDAVSVAGEAWAAERDRLPLSGDEAHAVRARLFALAGETARSLDRVRWVVRAALADHRDLAELVFPARGRAAEAPAADTSAPPAPMSGDSSTEAEPVPPTVAKPEAQAKSPGLRRAKQTPAADPASSAAKGEPKARPTSTRGRRRSEKAPVDEPSSPPAATVKEVQPRSKGGRRRSDAVPSDEAVTPAAANEPESHGTSTRGRRPPEPAPSVASRETAPATAGAGRSPERARSGPGATKQASSSGGAGAVRSPRRTVRSGRATRRS
jgi:hypothetical protein